MNDLTGDLFDGALPADPPTLAGVKEKPFREQLAEKIAAEPRFQTPWFAARPHIAWAIKSGWIPAPRNWRAVPVAQLTRAEKVMAFIERYCLIPQGPDVGKPLVLEDFQQAFLYSIYDTPAPTVVRTAWLSMARKNAKTATIAAVVLANIAGPEARRNAEIVSGAMAKDQAALLHQLAVQMVELNPKLAAVIHSVDFKKSLTGRRRNSKYRALAADGKNNQGLNPPLIIYDEAGQIVGPQTDFYEALETSQGGWPDGLMINISTQAASDADLMSQAMDTAERTRDATTVVHCYEHPKNEPIDDEDLWIFSNPGLGTIRDRNDLAAQIKKAAELPSKEHAVRNKNLNQRVALDGLFISPAVWRANDADPIDELFAAEPVHLGLDLSMTTDLTACVAAVVDPKTDICHLKTWAFAPIRGVAERESVDRAPYQQWMRSGELVGVPGAIVSYQWVCEWLAIACAGMTIKTLNFDRWRMDLFKTAADETGFHSAVENWVECGQGYVSLSPRLETFEKLLLEKRIAHGSQPLLNMAASNAIVISDPAGNRKVDKSKSTQRIDPLVAAIMAAHAATDGDDKRAFDVNALIG